MKQNNSTQLSGYSSNNIYRRNDSPDLPDPQITLLPRFSRILCRKSACVPLVAVQFSSVQFSSVHFSSVQFLRNSMFAGIRRLPGVFGKPEIRPANSSWLKAHGWGIPLNPSILSGALHGLYRRKFMRFFCFLLICPWFVFGLYGF